MKNQDRAFQKYLIISFLLHVLFIAVFIYGVPSLLKKKSEESPIIIFEMLDASDVLNVKNQNPKVDKNLEIKESKHVKTAQQKIEQNVETETIKEDAKTSEQKLDKTLEIIPEKKKEPQVPKKIAKKKEKPQKPKIKPKTKAKTKTKKVTKSKKKQEDVIDSILKNLEKESEGQELNSLNSSKASNADEGKFAKGDYDGQSPLSVTEKLLIKQQVEKNWQPPVGVLNFEGIEVILNLKMDQNGAVKTVTVKDVVCPASAGANCDLIAKSAQRAVKKASPLQNLRKDRYDVWKEFDLRFDPSKI